ncbi:carboxypeptidase-like regulatory domain-containing protein [Pendulispora brunnea]|uniref:Carboxypeptidase-like regulatory domain-containing protein n=1 Tax=Pendulispora brunnea TaxID=2905690 RepID=A0ABZ2KQW4_9BACT
MRSHSTLLVSLVLVATGLIALAPGCGSSNGSEFPGPQDPDGSLPDGDPRFGEAGTLDARPCTGLCRQQVDCPNGGDTTVSGIVYDPAGKVPLYNVAVYVPNAPVGDIKTGASCDRCDSALYSGDPLTGTLTNAKGEFKIPRVPVGADIPLVIQVGKWRRQIKIPTVASCVNTPLADKNQTRLPKNSKEGNIPLIAITTGGADSIECLPRRMGIDDSEFSTKGGPGRIHLYKGEDLIAQDPNDSQFARGKFDNGTEFKPSTDLWSNTNQLKAYDMVILSCEGTINPRSKPPAARNALYEYETLGGRVFASHWHRYWFSDGPDPVPSIANNGGWKDNIQGEQEQTAVVQVGSNLPKVIAFADWLQNVHATEKRGELKITAARDNLNSVNRNVATEWATIPQYQQKKNDGSIVNATPAAAVQFVSYNAPIGAADDKICGRAVFTDLHVSSGARNDHAGDGKTFPDGCENADLSPQEKALEFMLFDLASCVSSDHEPPPPPVVH